MKKIIILYQSKYGATKKYADWLSEELSCSAIPIKQADISQMRQYDTIILGGGVYASGITGLSFIKKHYGDLKDKNIVVFAVGASPYDEKAISELRNRQLKDQLVNIPFFYCRGAWNEGMLTWKDRALCNMLKKAVSKKALADYAPWEAALMQAIGSKADWTDKAYLKPIIERVG